MNEPARADRDANSGSLTGQHDVSPSKNGTITGIYLTKCKKNPVKEITTNGRNALILLILKLNSTILYNPARK